MFKSWLKKEISAKYPDAEFDVLTPPDDKMGDYSINLAFVLAKNNGTTPPEEGREIIEKLSEDVEFKKRFSQIEFVVPGFINFYLSGDSLTGAIKEALGKGDGFGSSELGGGKKINLEFVSANPTGPPTVGNARAASYGDALGNILKKAGFGVVKEYYVNDVGVQVKRLAESVKLRMSELKGEQVEFGAELYQGEYIKEMAREFLDDSVAEDQIGERAVRLMTEKAKINMETLGVVFDEWFLESKLHESGEVQHAYSELESQGFVVEEEGAKWLKMDGLPGRGDQKAVLIKSDGSTTYLMNDIAYTKNKFERGFDKVINIWGTDHHGDVPRLKFGVTALGYEPERLEILLHQLVALKKGGQLVRMSKRKGDIETLDGLVAEAGKDAVRYFFLLKDLNTHMEFDVDLAKEESKKNPVYYIQYSNARLNSILEKAKNEKLKIESADTELLKEDEELTLMRRIAKFPELIEDIAQSYQVHHLAQYAYELASDFHKFYEKHRVITDKEELSSARLSLSVAVKQVLEICLGLMGISAPQKM